MKEWAVVVVVKWSACSTSIPKIRLQIPLKIKVFFCKISIWKEQRLDENIEDILRSSRDLITFLFQFYATSVVKTRCQPTKCLATFRCRWTITPFSRRFKTSFQKMRSSSARAPTRWTSAERFWQIIFQGSKRTNRHIISANIFCMTNHTHYLTVNCIT